MLVKLIHYVINEYIKTQFLTYKEETWTNYLTQVQSMCYVIAIPTYNRFRTISKKVLQALNTNGIPAKRIFLFVASEAQALLYRIAVPLDFYGEIIVGELGIKNQRNFIRNFFPVGQHVVSVDDDVTRLKRLVNNKLENVSDWNTFFNDAFAMLEQSGLYLWGVYPNTSIMFMKGCNEVTTDLRFITGGMHGYIVRRLPELELTIESKEDYEQSIKYWNMDGGVIRFNRYCLNASVPHEGGLGKDRNTIAEQSSALLKQMFPHQVIQFTRKGGLSEVYLREFVKS